MVFLVAFSAIVLGIVGFSGMRSGDKNAAIAQTASISYTGLPPFKVSANRCRNSDFCNRYIENVKAEYFFGPQQEYGNLGYGDIWMQSRSYKKLF